MPNSPVRAAAEGLPHLNRRNLIARVGAALVAVPAVAAAATATAEATHGRFSDLTRLIARYRWLSARAEDAAEELCRIDDQNPVDLPSVEVGRRSILEDTGDKTWKPILCFNAEDVDQFAARLRNPSLGDEYEEEIGAKRRAWQAELAQKTQAYNDANEAIGYAAAERAEAAAYEAKWAAQDAIFDYLPTTLEEYQARDAFLLALMDDEGFEFDHFHLCAIFGGAPSGLTKRDIEDGELA